MIGKRIHLKFRFTYGYTLGHTPVWNWLAHNDEFGIHAKGNVFRFEMKIVFQPDFVQKLKIIPDGFLKLYFIFLPLIEKRIFTFCNIFYMCNNSEIIVINDHKVLALRNGTLFQKMFWTTVKKKCSTHLSRKTYSNSER